MTQRTLLTLSTGACLLGLRGLYALFVGPLANPPLEAAPTPSAAAARAALPPKARETLDLAARYFPHAAWARDAKYQLRNDRTIVYTEEWERLEDARRVRFRPFAMVWKPEDPNSTDDPVTIECESAVIEFARKFEITSPDPGRVVGGALEGAVRLAGPNGMRLATRNIIFSEEAKRAWTDHRVEFAYDRHQGQSLGLDVDLIPESGPVGTDKPAIAGARAVRLVSQVLMRLVPKSSRPDRAEESVTVTCDGSFEYELESHVASFEKNVRVTRPTGNKQHDRLNCQKLTLVFEPEESAESSQGGPRGEQFDGGPSRAGQLRFRRLLASGQGTTAVSQRGQMSARMTELTYDEQSRQVVMTDPKEVRLAQRQNLMLCQQVLAVLDSDGQVERAMCRGTGRVYRYQAGPSRGEQQAEFAARWNRQLRLDPEPASGLDLIELSGGVRLERPGQLTLEADTVRIWVTPTRGGPAAEPVSEPRDRDGQVRRNGNPQRGESTTPKRLLAINQVMFSSARLTGGTERLEVWFEEPRDGEPAAEGNRAAAASTSAGKPAQSPARSPDETAPSNQPPLRLLADRVRIRAELGRDEARAAEVVTDGHVRLTQDHEPGAPGLDIQGEFLHLWNRSETDQVLDLTGRPAHVRDRGYQVEGPQIHFDRGGNTARVDGAGVLRLPVNRGLDGQPLAQPQMLDIFWQKEMNFDGQTARFIAGVKTHLAGNEVACEEMHVALNQRVDFSVGGPQEAVDVDQVRCRDGVRLRSHEYEANKLTGVRLAEGFEFAFNQKTGEVVATGPGWFCFWRRGTGNRAAFRAASSSRANKPLAQEPAEWEYSRVDFAGNMKGNMNQRVVRFHDRVRVIYGPVDRADGTFDEENLPPHGGWMRCEELLISQRERPAPLKPYVMLRGRNNVDLEGKSEQGLFHVKAYTVSYDESKELYVISGDGKRDATITREARVGANRGSNSAQRMEFIPSRDELKIERASSAEGRP